MKSKLTNGIILALAILGGLFIFLVMFIAVTDGNDASYTAPTIRDDIEIKQDYTPAPPTRNVSDYVGVAFEQAFMDGCTSEGASRGACQCMFNYLDTRLTNSELNNLNIETNPVASEAVLECYDK